MDAINVDLRHRVIKILKWSFFHSSESNGINSIATSNLILSKKSTDNMVEWSLLLTTVGLSFVNIKYEKIIWLMSWYYYFHFYLSILSNGNP